MPGFSVNIGADTTQLVTGLNNARSSLAQFNNSLAPLNRNISLTGLSFSGIASSAKAAAPAINSAGTALSNIKPGANQAANALTNLGRVAQDAPFGFIGIQNNLNPLLESFQRLKKETGSTGGALKALGSSLMGAGGVGLALSVVSSAFLIFGNSTKGAKKELEGFDKALEDSNKKAGDELARVQVLNAVLTDNTRTQKERKSAAKELSDTLKDLNIDMSKEAILNGQVAEATKLATQAIIERARARAIEARIGDISGQQLQRDIQRTAAADKLKKAQQDLIDQEKIRQQTIGGGTVPGVGGNTITATLAVDKLTNEIATLDKATSEANKEIGFLIGQIKSNDLKIGFNKGSEKDVDLLKQRIAALKEIQTLQGLDAKQRVELVQLEIKLINRDGPKLGFSPTEIKQQADAILEKEFPVKTFEYETLVTTRVNKLEVSKVQDAKPLTDGFKTDIAKALGIGDTIEIPTPDFVFTNLDSKAENARKQLEATINDIVMNLQVEAFATLGELIGDTLMGGSNIGDILKGFIGIVAEGLKHIGKALIAYAAALLGFQIAVKSFSPVVALIAGVAAIAAGSAIQASLPKFATGGIVTGPLIGQIGEMHRPEVIMPLDRLPQMLRQYGGGGNDMQFIPIINNEGLYLAMKRGERRAGRKF
jgi:hypothetical protein